MTGRRARWSTLSAAAVLGAVVLPAAGCASDAQPPSAEPETTPASASPPPTAAASGTPAAALWLTRASSGRRHTVAMGAVIRLSLPTGFDWDPVAASTDAVRIVGGSSAAAADAMWEIRTQRPGRAVVTAHGRPLCRKGEHCPDPIDFEATLDVVE